jgi:hypothetical protein
MTPKQADIIARAVRVERLSVPEKPQGEFSSTVGVRKDKPIAKHPTDVRFHKEKRSTTEP